MPWIPPAPMFNLKIKIICAQLKNYVVFTLKIFFIGVYTVIHMYIYTYIYHLYVGKLEECYNSFY